MNLKNNLLTWLLIIFPICAHAESDLLQFSPYEVENRQGLPLCVVAENEVWVNKKIQELQAQGHSTVEYKGEGQFCYSSNSNTSDQADHCFEYRSGDNHTWILKKGSETMNTFARKSSAFEQAAYLHAGGECIFPFTFYLQLKD